MTLLRILIAIAAMLFVAGLSPAEANPPRHATGSWQTAPGYYRIRDINSGLCLTDTRPLPLQDHHLAQTTCSSDQRQTFLILPAVRHHTADDNDYVISWQEMTDPTQGPCATVARGVLFGDPRVDLHVCDRNGDQTFNVAGLPGTSIESDRYTIRHWHLNDSWSLTAAPLGQWACWDIRNESRDRGGEVLVVMNCGLRSEAFQLIYMGPPRTPSDVAVARAAGW